MKRRPRKAQPPLLKPLRKRGCLVFPELKGKTVDSVELWLASDYRGINIWLQDRTCLHFDMDHELTVSSEYSDWKSGNGRSIKSWPATQNTR